MMKKTIILISLIVSIFFVISTNVCDAQNLTDWKDVLDSGAGDTGAGYKTDGVKSPESVIALIIKTLLSFLGVIFLILMVYGGMLWMTARGNNEQVTKAKDLITAAIIGLIIVLLSYAISYFVINALTKATLSS